MPTYGNSSPAKKARRPCSPPFSHARSAAVPMIAISACSAMNAMSSREATPKPSASGSCGATAIQQKRHVLVHRGAAAGHALARHHVDETARRGAERAQARVGTRRGHQHDRRQVRGRCQRIQFTRFLDRQVRQDEAERPGLGEAAHENLVAHFESRVVVAHHQHAEREMRAHAGHELEALLHGRAVRQRLLVGFHEQRTVGRGLGERELQFDQVHAELGHDLQLAPVVLEARVAAHHVRHHQQFLRAAARREVFTQAHTVPPCCR